MPINTHCSDHINLEIKQYYEGFKALKNRSEE